MRDCGGNMPVHNNHNKGRKMKRIIFATALVLAQALAVSPASAKPEYTTPPINPFDSRGYCFHTACPTLHLDATVVALTANPTWPMQGPVPTYIPFIFLGIDNKGYSNWWDAYAFLVSPNGTRIPLGKGVSDDGNDLESINFRCQPLYNLNPCNPSISWFQPIIPVTTPVGMYALEIQFFLYDGRFDATYTFGPNFMVVTGQNLPNTLDGKTCKVAGNRRTVDGIQYACLKKGKRLAWQRMF